MGFVWTVPPEQAFTDLYDQLAARLRQQAIAACYKLAPQIENWLKDNAPWTDRTGNARQALYAEVIPAIGEIVILLSHGVDYGFYLETKYAGRYAVIAPAIDHWLPVVIREMQQVIRS